MITCRALPRSHWFSHKCVYVFLCSAVKQYLPQDILWFYEYDLIFSFHFSNKNPLLDIRYAVVCHIIAFDHSKKWSAALAPSVCQKLTV